jgi:two-component system, NarL family, nitrate/nitrite response regulator NarL
MQAEGTRALVVEDHPIVSGPLCLALRAMRIFAAIEVVDTLAGAQQAMRERSYGFVILDLHLRDASGLDALAALREEFPDTPTVIFSGDESVATMANAFEYGIRGYISKSTPTPVVASAIRMILAGGSYIPEHAAAALGIKAPPGSAVNALEEDSAHYLTPRQQEVFHALLEGLPNKVIGARLGMADGTVKAHMNTIYRSLGVRNRAQAILRARDLGLL